MEEYWLADQITEDRKVWSGLKLKLFEPLSPRASEPNILLARKIFYCPTIAMPICLRRQWLRVTHDSSLSTAATDSVSGTSVLIDILATTSMV